MNLDLMNGNCHFVYGLAVGSMIALNLDRLQMILPNITDNESTATLFIIGGVFGGILPDMDNDKSFIAKMSQPFSTIVCKIGKKLGRGGKYHRGIMHDPLIHFVGLILSYFYFPPLLGMFIGGISHIFLDIFNPVGLPLLFGVKYVSIAEITSGSKNAIWFTYANVLYILLIGVAAKLGLFTPMIVI